MTRLAGTLFGCTLILGIAACSSGTPQQSSKALEEKMKEIAEKMKASMPKTQEIAMKQKVDPELVKKVQEELRALKEYLDEPDGKIDMVTVNAIEAFQRRVGLREDGLLDERTLSRLEEEAKKAGAAGKG